MDIEERGLHTPQSIERDLGGACSFEAAVSFNRADGLQIPQRVDADFVEPCAAFRPHVFDQGHGAICLKVAIPLIPAALA